MEPLEFLTSEVFAVAKCDLSLGDVLDSIGGTTYYSLIDTYQIAKKECLLPIGLAKGAKIVRPVKIDTPITYDDVEILPSVVLELRNIQDSWFKGLVTEDEMFKKINDLALN